MAQRITYGMACEPPTCHRRSPPPAPEHQRALAAPRRRVDAEKVLRARPDALASLAEDRGRGGERDPPDAGAARRGARGRSGGSPEGGAEGDEGRLIATAPSASAPWGSE